MSHEVTVKYPRGTVTTMAAMGNRAVPTMTGNGGVTAGETVATSKRVATRLASTVIEENPSKRLAQGRPWVRLRAVRMVRRDPDRHMRTAALMALAVLVVTAPAAGQPYDPSYEVGYAAVSNPATVRSAMAGGGGSSASFCDDLLKRELVHGKSMVLHYVEFLRGCNHAVGDAME